MILWYSSLIFHVILVLHGSITLVDHFVLLRDYCIRRFYSIILFILKLILLLYHAIVLLYYPIFLIYNSIQVFVHSAIQLSNYSIIRFIIIILLFLFFPKQRLR